MQIPLCYDQSDIALYSGGFADVWMGEYQGRKVAVKVLRVYPHIMTDLDKIAGVGCLRRSQTCVLTSGQRFCKEIVMWKTLRHLNVLPLLGVTMSHKQFAMVSEWMENGNINEYIKAHRDANRFELVSFAFPLVSLLTGSHFTPIAPRCRKGIDIYARPGDNPRKSEGGMRSEPSHVLPPNSSFY